MILGTGAGQLVLLAATPILTRLYTKNDFGLLALFTAILAVFAVISAGRYELAIPLPKHNEDAKALLQLSLVLVLCTALLASGVVALWRDDIADILNAPGLAPILWLLPASVALVGSYQVLSKWAVRVGRFRQIGATRFTQAVGGVSLQLLAHPLGAGALVAGQATAQGVGAVTLGRSAIRHSTIGLFSRAQTIGQARRYSSFPKYSVGTALLNTGGMHLAPLAIGAMFGAPQVGLYALTMRVLAAPATVVGEAIGNVFAAKAPKAKRTNFLAHLTEQVHFRLVLLGSVPLAVTVFFGPDLFQLLFGAPWRSAGHYAQILAPWIYLQFQWAPLSHLVATLEAQRAALVAQMADFMSRFAALFIAFQLNFGALHAISAYAAISALSYGVHLIWFASRAGARVHVMLYREVAVLTLAVSTTGLFWLALGST